jgi:hypothetical protein
MNKSKSIVEQALLQVETLENVVSKNAKGILTSVMKEELNNLLKEEKEDEDPEEEEKDIEGEESPENDETSITDDVPDEEMPDDEESPEEEETTSEEMPGEESFGELEGEEGMEEEPLDLRGASDEEVGKIFQAMNPTDAIIVAKNDDNIQVKIEDKDYIIKLNEQEDTYDVAEEDLVGVADEDEFGSEEDEFGSDEEFGGGENYDIEAGEDEYGDEQIYEIELDEIDDDVEECGSSKAKEGEYTEAARTKWNPHGNKGPNRRAGIKDSRGVASKKIFKAGSAPYGLNEEVKALKKQNAEYKKALLIFKDKLNEVAVFNANLAYATRLLTEHTTTKSEKLDILKRFDSVSTIAESKQLYNTIKLELTNKKPVVESVAEKITSTPKSSSTQILSETKTYENAQFKRMKELMGINKIK